MMPGKLICLHLFSFYLYQLAKGASVHSRWKEKFVRKYVQVVREMFHSSLLYSSMNKQAKICMAGRETDLLYTILLFLVSQEIASLEKYSILLNISVSHEKSVLFHASLKFFLKLTHYSLSNIQEMTKMQTCTKTIRTIINKTNFAIFEKFEN